MIEDGQFYLLRLKRFKNKSELKFLVSLDAEVKIDKFIGVVKKHFPGWHQMLVKLSLREFERRLAESRKVSDVDPNRVYNESVWRDILNSAGNYFENF